MPPTSNTAEMEVNIWSDQQTPRVQYEEFRIQGSSEAAEVAGTWGYRRCLDFDADGLRGQDYCAVRGGAGFVVGVVADGVGQSYYGDIAAQEVSRFLVDYLWEQRPIPPPGPDIEGKLLALARKVDVEVQRRRPANPNLEEALAPVRERSGSQAVFAAFILDARGKRRNLTVYQVGDIFTWVFDRERARRVEADPNGRWASRGRSDLRLQTQTFVDVTGIVLHSDGLRSGWAEQLKEPSVLPQSFEAEVEERAKVDDLSFIAIEIRPPVLSSHQKRFEGKPKVTLLNVTDYTSAREGAVATPPDPGDAPPPITPQGVLPRRTHRRPFVAGFLTGLVTGASVALFVYFFFFQEPAGTRAGMPGPSKHESPPTITSSPPPPPPRTVKALDVVPERLAQRGFFDRFGFFPESPTRQDGEVIAHIDIQIGGVSNFRISAGASRRLKVRPCSTVENCFLAYLPGPAEQQEIVFEVDMKDSSLGRGQVRLPGRQPKVARGDRFLGYYKIVLRPAEQSGGKS